MLKNLSTKTRWAIGAACALVSLVVCAVIVYAANYSGRALPGTLHVAADQAVVIEKGSTIQIF